MKILFFDLETTGVDYTKDAIIQFAGVMANLDTDNNLKVLDKFNYEMRPEKGKRIDSVALEINGYTIDQIKNFKPSKEVFYEFQELLKKHCDKFNKLDKFMLIGYNNLHFDNDFLRQWFVDCGDKYFGSWFWSNGIDVMSEAGRYLIQYRPAISNFKLGTVASALGISIDSNELHDGFYDIKLTMKIFLMLLKEPLFKPFSEEEAERLYKEKIILEKNQKYKEKKSEIFYMD